MGERYEQNLERDFDGRINELFALALGIYKLVSTPRLVSHLSRVTEKVRGVHTRPVDMTMREVDEAIGLVEEETGIGEEIRLRNPRKVGRLRRRYPIHFGHIPGIHPGRDEELEKI